MVKKLNINGDRLIAIYAHAELFYVMFMAYLSLFFSAFISATLLPSSSELVMTAMIASGDYLLWLLWWQL